MFFQKKIGTVFLKEDSEADQFIQKMNTLSAQAKGALKDEIEKQIKLASYGVSGEQNIAFELKNSGMDMYVLHDIFLECGEHSAQIDYIIITRKRSYVIECKNLIGNVEIDSQGNFVRRYELFGSKITEGIYSPITQNQRHLLVMKELRKESKKGFLSKMRFENGFEHAYKSLVVLANPKTYLNSKYAPKEVKAQVIRADQLISVIQKMDGELEYSMKQEEMLEAAEFFLSHHCPNKSDYAEKYEKLVQEMQVKPKGVLPEASENSASVCIQNNQGAVCYEELRAKLKAFRLEQSRKEQIKPYYVFTDVQMEDLLNRNPKTKEELLQVSGFGPKKVEKYGDYILQLMQEQA